jgi:hypothetical protein
MARVYAFCWVCLRVGMVPWYIVVRLTRSMCRPQLHPSVCRGVLLKMTWGVACCRSRGAMGSPVYHRRNVLWILVVACGGLKFRES